MGWRTSSQLIAMPMRCQLVFGFELRSHEFDLSGKLLVHRKCKAICGKRNSRRVTASAIAPQEFACDRIGGTRNCTWESPCSKGVGRGHREMNMFEGGVPIENKILRNLNLTSLLNTFIFIESALSYSRKF